MSEAPAHQTRASTSTAHPSAGPPTALFSARKRDPTSAHARANDGRGTQHQTKWPSHACAARREGILSRQDDVRTPRGRRARPCAVHKRAHMSTAGGAGGRRALGEADGQQTGCCGGRACPGEWMRGPARLQGVKRVAARAGLQHCQTAHSRVLGLWYSSPFDDLASLLPSTALLNHKGKRRGRFWGQWAGRTGFGISAGGWMHLNWRYGMRLRADGECTINWHGHEEKELLHVPRQSCKGAGGKNGANGVPPKDCGKLLRGQPWSSERSRSRDGKYSVSTKTRLLTGPQAASPLV